MKRDLPKKYIEAEAEAKRFLSRMNELRTRYREDDGFYRYFFMGGMETAALKRSSLDLTRALSRLRK